MSQFAVRPDNLADAAALTATDAAALDEAGRLVLAAAREAAGALGTGAGPLDSALEHYAHVETVACTALGAAADVLSRGLASASARYAAADTALTRLLGSS